MENQSTKPDLFHFSTSATTFTPAEQFQLAAELLAGYPVALENVEQIARVHPHDLVGQIADIPLFVVLLMPIFEHVLQHGIILIHKWLWLMVWSIQKMFVILQPLNSKITMPKEATGELVPSRLFGHYSYNRVKRLLLTGWGLFYTRPRGQWAHSRR